LRALGAVIPGAASQYAAERSFGAFGARHEGIGHLGGGVRAVIIRDPLPNISAHVEDAKGARSLGRTSDRDRAMAFSADAIHSTEHGELARPRLVVPPWIFAFV